MPGLSDSPGGDGGDGDMRERREPALLDASHLDRQVLGDSGLRAELLHLYATRLEQLQAKLGVAHGSERREAAHALKGASLAVGAFALARLCEGIECSEPEDAVAFERVLAATRVRVAALLGGHR